MSSEAQGKVLHLFQKAKGARHSERSTVLRFSPAGISGNKPYSPLRQVLITAQSDIAALGYLPGELRENIVVDFPRLHDLVSGSVLGVGPALIQLTFHCEPCSRIPARGNVKSLLHRRGVLGKFLNEGVIRIGDEVGVAGRVDEYIPYAASERIAWFLEKHRRPIGAAQLLFEVGLPPSYARALPAILRKLPSIEEDCVIFASGRTRAG